jgi:hypothetical protein
MNKLLSLSALLLCLGAVGCLADATDEQGDVTAARAEGAIAAREAPSLDAASLDATAGDEVIAVDVLDGSEQQDDAGNGPDPTPWYDEADGDGRGPDPTPWTGDEEEEEQEPCDEDSRAQDGDGNGPDPTPWYLGSDTSHEPDPQPWRAVHTKTALIE